MLPKKPYDNWRLHVILKNGRILPYDIKWEDIAGWKEGTSEEIINKAKKELLGNNEEDCSN